MSLNIKNREAEQLARELASITGESVTQAVAIAVRERLDRVQHEDHAAIDGCVGRLQEIAKDAAGRWTEPYRSTDHGELLYDELGLPR